MLCLVTQLCAIPSCRSAYQPKIWTEVFHIARRFFTIWATREPENNGAYPFSRGSSWPKNQTGVSCIAGEFFTNWATREAHLSVVVQSLNHVWFLVIPWTAVHQASLSFTIFWSLLKLMSIESVMLFNHLILCHFLLFLPSIFSSIRVFSNELAHHIRWPNYWSFSFSISPSNEYLGLIFFRIDWLDLLAVQGISRVFSNTTVQNHQFFGTQLSL